MVSYDLVNRGYGEVQNFFELLMPPFDGEFAIVTNPPYKIALEFVLHALELVPEGCYVCMFVKTTFLEGKRRYSELFSSQPPYMVLQFIERIICAKNGDFEEAKKIGSAVSYCWMIWKKGSVGKTIIDWI